MIIENTYHKIKWLLVKSPTKSNLAYLHEEFDIDNHDLKATLPPLQRPRLIARDHYLMIIMQFPYYNKETGEIHSSEVDFFIGKNLLITVTDGNLPPLQELFDTLETDSAAVSKNSRDDLGNLIYEILHRAMLYLQPMLNHISQDLDKIEEKILKEIAVKKDAITDILIIKRNIVNFRRIMQSHRDVIRKMIDDPGKFFSADRLKQYFNNLIVHTMEVWSTLENYRETINALNETHESLVSFQINQVMKRLNVFAVIVFPLTLMAAIFGMNAPDMPIVNGPHGFWIIIGIMLAGVLVMWGYFRHKKWI
jgi:magnesium transporter